MPGPHVIGFDLETVPQPLDRLSDRQRRRHDRMVEGELARDHTPPANAETVSAKVRSLHPMLGWIICISVQRADGQGNRQDPKSYLAASMAEERPMLEQFWSDLSLLRGPVRWVSFNGKRFDADWLRVRSAAHGLAPPAWTSSTAIRSSTRPTVT